MLLYPFDNPNRILFVRLYFLFCSRVIISRSYGNRSKGMNIICLESYMARKEEEKKRFFSRFVHKFTLSAFWNKIIQSCNSPIISYRYHPCFYYPRHHYHYRYYYYLYYHSFCWCSFCASVGCKPCT